MTVRKELRGALLGFAVRAATETQDGEHGRVGSGYTHYKITYYKGLCLRPVGDIGGR